MKYIGISSQAEHDIKRALIKRGDYSIWGDAHKKLGTVLKSYIKHNYNLNVSFEKMGSIRRVYMRDKYIKRFHFLKKHISDMVKDYSSGMDILTISRKYDFPPIASIRAILSREYSKDNIKKIMKDPNLLEGRDREQFIMAMENDYIGDINQDAIVEGANNFEREIESFFDKKHIPYRTQAELAKDQIQLVERAVVTPDLYFPQGVMINGQKLYWIDAKNYYGGNASYVYQSVNKQAEKYNKMYGSGAFIFKHGFSESLARRVNAMFIEW
ncbi:MAG: hypothetical protein E6R13_01945 [Spirochaetes bacterium]|nr:MAG: hypothetical protein E6R13_01945 [Spirochaetota bacterium]